MNLSEWFWGKVGFATIGIFAGTIWCILLYPLFNFVNPEISGALLYKIFVGIFVLVSLISEKYIGHAGLGALFIMAGFLIGVIGTVTYVAPEGRWLKAGKELTFCLIIGILAGVLAFLWQFRLL